MKLWTAEQTARRMTAFLMVSGLVFVVGFGFLACLNIREGRVNVTFLALAVIGLALLVQASGMVYYLRRRGRSGVRGAVWLLHRFRRDRRDHRICFEG